MPHRLAQAATEFDAYTMLKEKGRDLNQAACTIEMHAAKRENLFDLRTD